jgi:hypothetical protein
MARTRQRAIRIDEEHEDFLDSLPKGTVNTFFNEMIRLVRSEPALQRGIVLSDERFKDWKAPEGAPTVADAAEGELVTVDPKAKKAKEEAEIEAAVHESSVGEVEEALTAMGEDAGTVVDTAIKNEIAEPGKAFDEAVTPEPPVEKPVEPVEKQPVPAKSTLEDLFPGL